MWCKLRSWIVTLLRLRLRPFRWQIPCCLVLGVAGGTGFFVFHVSRATSYLSDDPETCMNCHVMTTQYLTWQHSSHSRVATCNDCHVPHTSLAAHWAFKAKDGLRHASMFTLRLEPQVIRLSHGAVPVVEENCRRCHASVVEDVSVHSHAAGDLRCWDCHREVPHGRTRSLSAAPNVFQPRLPGPHSVYQQPRVGGRSARPATESSRD